MRADVSGPAETHISEYDRFAAVYNEWMAEDFCRRALPAVDRLLLQNLTPGMNILDLCCGSGQMARALLQRGFRVTGVDASERMLEFAQKNAPDAQFLRADARDLKLQAQFHAALSTFNSLSHVKPSELVAVFCAVKSALLPGALFLFDLSMEKAYNSKWRGSFSLVEESRVCVVRPSYDPQTRMGSNRVTLFETVRSSRGATWKRSDFSISQFCHPEDDLREALRQAGFRNVRILDAQHDLGISGESGHAFVLCRQ